MGVIFKVILWPFSVLYRLVTQWRNHLYNIGYKKSFQFETTVIGVGNLSIGGNGKTPLVEYLIRLLQPDHQLATLSRGYGRATRGFRLAGVQDDATTLGDEPYQLHLKFGPQVTVAVGEQRALAIPQILMENPQTDIIILDDSFQHRAVVPQVNIIVSDFERPFFQDLVLPAGRLRESRRGASRADIIVFSKCPRDLDLTTQQHYRQSTAVYAPDAKITFSYINYNTPVSVLHDTPWPQDPQVLLVSGLARAQGLEQYISNKYALVEHVQFPDHHNYRKLDVKQMVSRLQALTKENKVLLTTEKDMVKLIAYKELLAGLPFYYLPISFKFLDEVDSFDAWVRNSLERVDDSPA